MFNSAKKLPEKVLIYGARGNYNHNFIFKLVNNGNTVLQPRFASSFSKVQQFIHKCLAFSSTNTNRSPKASLHGHTKPVEVFDQDWNPQRSDCHISFTDMKEQVGVYIYIYICATCNI